MVRLSRDFVFDSAHKLNNYEGACASTHGHRWTLRVVIEGEVNPETDMLIDFKYLKSIVNTSVINKLDHKFLNEIVSFNPTAENLSKYIYEQLKFALFFEGLRDRVNLVEVQLWETPDCCVTYGGK